LHGTGVKKGETALVIPSRATDCARNPRGCSRGGGGRRPSTRGGGRSARGPARSTPPTPQYGGSEGGATRACAPRRPTASGAAGGVKGRRTISLNGTTMEATLYERARLDVDATVEGAAIVEQFDATTLIPPPWSARVDGYGNVVLTRA